MSKTAAPQRCPASVAQARKTEGRRYGYGYQPLYTTDETGVLTATSLAVFDLERETHIKPKAHHVEQVIGALGDLRASCLAMGGDAMIDHGTVTSVTMRLMQPLMALWLSGALDTLWRELTEEEI